MNDKRFGLTDFYDKSTYLSKVRRPRGVIPFQHYDKRQKSLIAKGGDNGVDLQGKSDAFYDPIQDVTLPRRDKKVPILGKATTRERSFGSMYIQEADYTPDHYDSVKIAADMIKNRPNKKPMV